MEEILGKEIDEAIETQQLVFLVGAGISFEPPSYLTTWPQSDCIEALTTLDPDVEKKIVYAVRPEVFFQVLYNIIGKRALMPLEVLNPATLNSEEELASPNSLHFFLAKMLLKGHIVLTTNFDDLIERAYKKITGGEKLNVAIFDEDLQNLYEQLDLLKSGILIKIHGSFLTPEGKDCRDSIVAILQQVQREFPESKRNLVKKLIAEYDLIVMGYSGQDDFDLYSFLSNPPSNRRIWWIRHLQEKDMKKWQVLLGSQLKAENEKLGSIPAPLRTPKDWEILNSNSVVIASSNGVLIKAHTAKFVEQLGKYYSPSKTPDLEAKVRQKIQTMLKQWADSINSAEKYELLAGIFEAAGGDFLDAAQVYYNKANERKARLIDAQNILKNGTIHYKEGGKEKLYVAKNELKKALNEFKELSSIVDQAETCLQLLLVHNRLGIVEEGIKYGEIAVDLYRRLAEIDSSKIFELARALRGLALISIRGIPDVSTITKIEEKEHGIKILEEATKLCKVSFELLRRIGNRSGERGEGQTLNVLGVIKLRLEDYIEAEKCFDEFLNLSGRSRFLRESFQGYRNVALSEYNLALKELGKKKELDKAIMNYDHAIMCLGGDPKIPNQQPRSRDEFNTRYNRSCAKMERAEPGDMEFAMQELTTLKSDAPNIVPSHEVWHWRANILSALSKAYSKLDQDEGALRCIKELVQEYERVENNDIEKQPFGIQNAKQNLQSASKQIAKAKEAEDLDQKITKQLERIDNLSQSVPLLPLKDWSTIISQIETKFLKRHSTVIAE